MFVSRPMFAAGIVLAAVQAQGKAYTFNPSMLAGSVSEADLSLFNQGSQLPGTYSVDVLLNGTRVDYRSIVFESMPDKHDHQALLPCMTREVLSGYGIRMKGFKVTEEEIRTGQFDLSRIPGAQVDFRFNEQTLVLSIPQVYLKPSLTGIAPKTLWNDGIPAFILNYRAGSSQSVMRGSSGRTSQYSWLQLSPGANLGAWRLRNTTLWHQSKGTPGRWQAINTYLERGINDINSRLTLGERYTPSEIFDGVPFRGVMLASDDRMVPSSQYMFAPVIRGVARTQARVEVRQNGYTIYNQVVAPGPFALTDFNQTGSGGDFQVTVWETDGVPQVFTVPFQTPAVAIKEGYLRYSVMAGQYRSSDKGVIQAPVVESTAMYGLPGGFTLYGGIQAARHYQSSSLGVGLSLGDWGALSTDVKLSHGQSFGQPTVHGQSWRMRYSKEIVATNTLLSLVNFQFSQANYLTLGETLDSWRKDNVSFSQQRRIKKKSRTVISISQGLGKWGYLHASAFREIYWNNHRHNTHFNAGYSFPYNGMMLSLDWSLNQRGNRHRRNQITSLWLSVPLSKWMGGNIRASYRYTHASSGREIHSAGLNGDAFDQRLQWSVDQRYSPGKEDSGSNGDVYLGWTGTYGQLSGSYSYDRNYHQRSIALEGGVIAHSHGVTLTQALGETNALIEAKGASGVKVWGLPGIQTDYRGFTAQADLNPYHENNLSLDPTTLSPEAEIAITDKSVVPTAGAIILVKFKTNVGAKAIITLLRSDGTKVPFGSLVQVESASGNEGIVDEDGKVYMSGLPPHGNLIVRRKIKSLRCSYHLIKNDESRGLNFLTAQCK
ncbi:fimbria/pilus outer membrane usher protein [Pantoea anthophila]|uniref:fimbria/pilus outer membrane usher protein n=1 Tax=Pantoea anthophila TaxID=470931 RepID=UPI00301D94F2